MLVFKVFQKSELNENQIARELKFLLLNTIKLEQSRNKLDNVTNQEVLIKSRELKSNTQKKKQEKSVLVNPTKNNNFFH